MIISKAQFKTPANLKTEKYVIEEIGPDAFVYCRSMTSKELLDLQAKYKEQKNELGLMYDMIFACVVDGNGARIFDSADDVKDTFNLSLPALTALGQKCLEVSGLDTEKKS